jgi:hypothetical protein
VKREPRRIRFFAKIVEGAAYCDTESNRIDGKSLGGMAQNYRFSMDRPMLKY